MKKKSKSKFKKGILCLFLIAIVFVGYFIIFDGRKDMSIKILNNTFNKEVKKEKIGNNESNEKGLAIIKYGCTNYYDKGYYHIVSGNDESHIKYIDYAAKKEIYWCNKPNCTHKNSSCSAYLDLGLLSSDVFSYKNNVYLITASVQEEANNNDDGDISFSAVTESSTSIYKMNLDGTNKEKIFTTPSGVEMQYPYVIDNDTLYAFFSKGKIIPNGTNSSIVVTEKKLVKINLSTGKYEELLDAKYKNILGVYKNNIILSDTVFKNDPNKYAKDHTGYMNNLNESTLKLSLLDLTTMKETIFMEELYKNAETIEYFSGSVYFITKNSKKLEAVNVETKERSIITELPKTGASITGIYDNKLQYVYYAGSDGSVESACFVDLKTKENKQFKLFDENKLLVEILSQNDEYYFVRTGYKMSKEYKTWAGTIQSDIEDTYYGLIKKEDYWSSKANYINIKNAD